MSAVPITSPANDKDNLLDPIRGDFTLSNIGSPPPGVGSPPPPQPPPPGSVVVTIPEPVIIVWVKCEDTGEILPGIKAAIFTLTSNATSGSWTAAKPNGLVKGKQYTITATLSHPDFNPANDKKFHVVA